ncbi:ATP-binding protein [Shinella sp.]|uniref:ATP-binding protein n=1 Tax=Shinella sp. TaxID=1870904 RepID=UPI0029C07FF5|nr:ATP-binding protein [Shinella sp.]
MLRFRLSKLFSTIHGQITVIVLLALVMVISAGSALERWMRADFEIIGLENISERVSSIGSVLAEAKPSERVAILEIANRGDWKFSIRPLSLSQQFTTSSPTEPVVDVIVDWLFPPDDGAEPLGGWRTFLDGKRVIAVKIDDSEMLVLESLPGLSLRGDALNLGSNYLLAVVILMVLFSAFAVWTITRPLRRIAAAAMRADLSVGPALFEERGSQEIVALARALNGMQKRISTMIDSRTRMLRGVSHDLRTPLTRLRLRVERVDQQEVREALLADVERIDRLLKESLSYLRDNHRIEAFARADLASAVQTVCDEFEDIGHQITYRGPGRLIANFKPLAITRAVTNLCENATKFGSSVRVELGASAGMATIDVADDGPGIPVEHRSRVLEPFYKVDAARGGTDAGFGLGLSIVAEIVQDHGGKLELLDRHPNGLIARIAIPT